MGVEVDSSVIPLLLCLLLLLCCCICCCYFDGAVVVAFGDLWCMVLLLLLSLLIYLYWCQYERLRITRILVFSRQDWGAILLVDERFSKFKRYSNGEYNK